MPATPHYVTSDEFTRYIAEENNFRSRLEGRLAADHQTVRNDLTEIKGLVRETNGRVVKAEHELNVMRRDFEALKSENLDIEKTVHEIRDDGCSQYANHKSILESGGDVTTAVVRPEFRLDHFSKRQKVVAGAGITLVMWPAIQEIASLLHDLVEWLNAHPIGTP